MYLKVATFRNISATSGRGFVPNTFILTFTTHELVSKPAFFRHEARKYMPQNFSTKLLFENARPGISNIYKMNFLRRSKKRKKKEKKKKFRK
jgi:hypothetical protein